jgi:hypothetical protein
MDFRSHLARPFDSRLRSNQALIALLVATGGAGLVLWLSGRPGTLLLAPIHVFLIWALLREIDPDHQWTAILGGVLTGVWVLTGGPIAPAWATAGLMLAGRITTSTTGRRLLFVDLAAVSFLGTVIGFTVEGWAAGFGIALALYLDDRFRGDDRFPAIAAAALTAAGTTVVATATGAFPATLPDVTQYLAVAAGLAALLLLTRDPALPASTVDARHAAFIDQARLHFSRSIVAVLVFLTTILTGPDAEGMAVIIAALGLAVVSNEVESIRRRNL